MNYFELFEMKPSFFVDEKALRNKFIANSRKYHPDYFNNEASTVQEENIDLSTLNNIAYKTLSDFDKRMEYILEQNEISINSDEQLSNDFLMEMMEINESIMELEFDFDQDKFNEIQNNVEFIEKNNFDKIQPLLLSFENQPFEKNDFVEVKKYFLKKKYLLRIRNQFSKFASHS